MSGKGMLIHVLPIEHIYKNERNRLQFEPGSPITISAWITITQATPHRVKNRIFDARYISGYVEEKVLI